MKYDYFDMYEHQFEKLVIEICHELLGPGVQGFATGPDGGRDARFRGTADCFPSRKAPLSGDVTIQAKHTERPFAKISDTEFCSDAKSSIVSEEIDRISKLRKKNEADHYLLFTNRRCPANASSQICERITKSTNTQTTHIVGVEDIDRYLKAYPDVVRRADINSCHTPLRVSPDEIAEVILELEKSKGLFGVVMKCKEADRIARTLFAQKNQINGLSVNYSSLIKKYIKDFSPIKKFLADPQNAAVQAKYMSAADEFQSAVISRRADFETFDRVLDYLIKLLIDRDSDLGRHRKLTRTIIYYMYWNCDLGEDKSVSHVE